MLFKGGISESKNEVPAAVVCSPNTRGPEVSGPNNANTTNTVAAANAKGLSPGSRRSLDFADVIGSGVGGFGTSNVAELGLYCSRVAIDTKKPLSAFWHGISLFSHKKCKYSRVFPEYFAASGNDRSSFSCIFILSTFIVPENKI